MLRKVASCHSVAGPGAVWLSKGCDIQGPGLPGLGQGALMAVHTRNRAIAAGGRLNQGAQACLWHMHLVTVRGEGWHPADGQPGLGPMPRLVSAACRPPPHSCRSMPWRCLSVVTHYAAPWLATGARLPVTT